MEGTEVRRGRYSAAMGAGQGTAAADRLCRACVELVPVHGAAISIIYNGTNHGTFGASSPDSRDMDELQFTVGEGPCLDAVAEQRSVYSADLADPAEQRWPAYTPAMLAAGIRSVHVAPITVAGVYLGALDLFRTGPGGFSDAEVTDAVVVAELAELPLLDLLDANMAQAADDPGSDAWSEINAISRVEVNQATGVLIGQLGITPVDALIRLRGYAYAHDMSTTAVAQAILDHQLRLDDDDGPTTQDEGDVTR